MIEKSKAAKQGSPKEAEDHVKVYLRLRPMDKLETSKRSKDCIDLHENPKLITVDSPLLGTFDFTFDLVSRDPSGRIPSMSSCGLTIFLPLDLLVKVFDEYTPQLEVYKESVSSIPKRLLNGVSCVVMAFGQTGSGKVRLTITCPPAVLH